MSTGEQDIFRYLYKKSNMCKNVLENGCTRNDEIKSRRICRGMGIELSEGESYCKFLCEMDGRVEKISDGKINYEELGLDRNNFFNVYYILSYGISHKIGIIKIINSIFAYFKSSFNYLNIITWFFLIKNIIFIYFIYLGEKYSLVKILIEMVPYPLLKTFARFYNNYQEKKRISKLSEDFSINNPEIPVHKIEIELKPTTVEKMEKMKKNIKEMEILIDSMEFYINMDIKNATFCDEVKDDLYFKGYLYSKYYNYIKNKNNYKNIKEKYIKTFEKYFKFIKQQVKNNICKNNITLGFTEENDIIEQDKNWVPPPVSLWDTGDILISKSLKRDRFKNWKIEDREEKFSNLSEDEIESYIQSQKEVFRKKDISSTPKNPISVPSKIWKEITDFASYFYM